MTFGNMEMFREETDHGFIGAAFDRGHFDLDPEPAARNGFDPILFRVRLDRHRNFHTLCLRRF